MNRAGRAAILAPGPWVANELWRRARAVPSLDLRFAERKDLVDAVTGQNLVTFTRASSATYVDSTGTLRIAATDVPRFTHDPATLESLGLLMEEQRTNLLVQSENFGTTWTTTGLLAFGSGSTLNAAVAPDGNTTADLITENSSTSEHRIETPGISWAANTTYTLTLYAKANGKTRLDFFAVGGGNFTGGRQVNFNLATGTVISTDGAVGSVSAVQNGWYRLRMTLTTSASPSSSSIFIRLNDNSNNFSYTGDGTSGVYFWGAQLEAGAFATSYIPTTTATVTRSGDVASITGTNFSSWYRQDRGVVYAFALTAPVNNVAQVVFDISDGTTNKRILVRRNTAGLIGGACVDNGVTQSDISQTAIGANGAARLAYTYQANDLGLYVNSDSGVFSASATLPTVDRLSIGTNLTSTQSLNGPMRRLTYWPQRLPNVTLQALTQ